MAVCSSEIFSSSVTACLRISRVSVLSNKWLTVKALPSMSDNFSQAEMEEGMERISKIAAKGCYKNKLDLRTTLNLVEIA